MIFSSPLIDGTLIKRYKRFLADILLNDGTMITAHCANPGAMLGITEPGSRVWVSFEDSPTRKLKYSWHMIAAEDTIIGMNTSWPNLLVAEALTNNMIDPLKGYADYRREVKYGVNSRIDILLTDPTKPSCYVEVKNVHLKRGDQAQFPDCVTARGAKHLGELNEMVRQGHRAVMLYVVQRDDCTSFSIAADIDPVYAQAAQSAFAQGVEAYAYTCHVDPTGIRLNRAIPVVQPDE